MRTTPALLILVLAACGEAGSDPFPSPPATSATSLVPLPPPGDAGLALPLPDPPDAGMFAIPEERPPYFVRVSGDTPTDELLTCAAHLFGQPLGNGTTLHTVPDLRIANPASLPATVLVSAQIQGFSAPGSAAIDLPPARTTVAPPLDLSLDFPALYRISAPLTANLTVSLLWPGNPAPLDVQSSTVLIYPKNTIFWAKANAQGGYDDLRFLVSLFVTPHDQGRAIDQLLTEAAAFSYWGAMLGYQYMNRVETPSAWQGTAQPGYCKFATLPLRRGSEYTFQARSSCPGCRGESGYLRVHTQADWQGDRSQPLVDLTELGEGATTLVIPATDTYVVAACNAPDAGAARAFTFGVTPTLTPASAAMDQLSAIFLALQQRRIAYVNVPKDFFAGAQNVKYPAESLATGSANCIDGALVFASALESMGMRPGIVMVPGHATIAVLVDPAADPCDLENWLPMETTLIASGTPEEAAAYDLSTVLPQVEGVFAQGCTGFKAHRAALFDIQTLRDMGFRPAPL
jgi:hypothetical protein